MTVPRITVAGQAAASRVITAALQFASLALVGRLQGAGPLGVVITYTAGARLAAGVLGAGVPTWLMRELSHSPSRSTLGTALGFSLRAGLLGAPVAVVGGVLVDVRPVDVVVATLGFLATIAVRAVSDGLKGLGKGAASLWAEYGVPPVVLGAASLGLHAVSASGDRWLLASAALASLISAVVALALIPPEWRPPIAALRARPVIPWRGLGPFGLSNMIGLGLVNLPPVLVASTLGAVAAGAFGAAQRLIALPTLVIVGLSTTYSPRFARAMHAADPDQAAELLRRSQVLLATALVPPLLAVLAAPSLFLTPFGEAVQDGGEIVLRILVVGQLANALTGLAPDLLLMTANPLREAQWSAGAGVILLIGSALTQVAGTGMAGFAWSASLAMTVRNLGCYLSARKAIDAQPQAAVLR